MAGGGQKGNTNAARGTLWRDAIDKALKQYKDDKCKRGEALFKIATKVVELAIIGSKDAIKEIGDRLDGKPGQSVELKGSIDARIFPIEYVGQDEDE